MRRVAVLFLLIVSLGLCSCGGALHSQQPPPKWTRGFWFWQGSSVGSFASTTEPLDELYFQAGEINNNVGPGFHDWSVYAQLPEELPPAGEYWIVLRFNRQAVPDLEAAPIVARRVSQLRATAEQRHLNVAGVQLDIDSPTRSLPQYAAFLRAVRKDLPPGVRISITALLDWFRDGTAVADVVKEVDEFVPQFYDLHDPRSYNADHAIAAKFDGAQWGPVFNRFGKRFRIGISSFGRARFVQRENVPPGSSLVMGPVLADLAPLDIASNSAFSLQSSRNDANELVLTYRAARKVSIGYNNFESGDGIQFILPTPETVRAGVENAKRIRGYCAGVVFFRWPASNETLAMPPEEVLAAADGPLQPNKPSGLELADGSCAAVACTDIFLISPNPLRSTPVRYRIHSSTELEYFLPEQRMPIRMADPSNLELSLPPYGARRRMYLGRAVTAKNAEFTIQEEPGKAEP
jgi:hypothetical protein